MTSRLHGACLSLLGVAFALTPVVATPAQSDATAIVGAARQALGGEARLAAVQALVIQGSHSRKLDSVVISESFESTVVLPGKFLRVSRRSMSLPVGGFEMTSYDGFNGDDVIHAVHAPNSPAPLFIPGPPPGTPEEADARRARLLDSKRQMFLRSMLPLFVLLPTPHASEMTAAGKAPIPGGQADVIEMKRADGTVWRLLIDDKSHLPLQLTWKAKPVVTMIRSSTAVGRVVVGPSGAAFPAQGSTANPVTDLPTGDPTASLPLVDWTMTIRDYKVSEGLNWPRRFTTAYAGQEHEDIRVSRYRINPKVDLKIFEGAKK